MSLFEWIFLLVVVGSGLCIVGVAVGVVYSDWEEAQAEAEQRKLFDVIHRTPAPMHERASQGFERRTKS